MRTVVKGILPAIFLMATGCGSSSNSGNPGTGAWDPLKLGNRWTYTVTEADGTVRTKVQGATAEIPAGGVGPFKDTMAFRLVTGTKFNDNTGDVSFQTVIDSRLVRLRELSIGASSGNLKNETFWDPPKLRIDDTADHTAMGAEWLESYAEHVLDTAKADGGVADAGDPADAGTPVDAAVVDTTQQMTDLWSVVAVADPVTVPAGTFKALKLKKVQQNTASIKYFWYVRGVGKIKEAGEVGSPEQTEELVSYTVSP